MTKCDYCDKTAKNRSGMSSHVKTSHPEKFLEWRKGSVMTSADKRKFQAQLNALVEPESPKRDFLPPRTEPAVDTSSAEYKRKYQKSWYWRNKKKALARQKQLDDARRKRWDNHKTELKPDNMNVVICPRCKCRFATMILEEGAV